MVGLNSPNPLTKRKYVPEFLLVLVTILWGTTFILTKQTTEAIPSFLYMAIRFGMAFIAMVPFLLKFGTFFSSWKNWKISLIAGIYYFISIATQTVGLQFTSASKGAFITSLGVIFVPLFISIFHKRKVHYLLWIAVIIAITGVGLLSFSKVEPISWGDPLILICAIAYALYVIYLDNHVHEVEIMPFTAIQLFLISFLSLIISLVYEFGIAQSIPAATTMFSIKNILVVLYLGVIATTLTFIMQSHGQRFVSSTRASLIFAFEPFFATLFAIWIGGENLSLTVGIGMILVFSSVMISIFSPQNSLKTTKIIISED
ncbi:MAG: DMT family transporter [Promethearchaeota archaeon]|nr:MAG: DMT family transporter [Candidatus Lokiarchaeota archaeon]